MLVKGYAVGRFNDVGSSELKLACFKIIRSQRRRDKLCRLLPELPIVFGIPISLVVILQIHEILLRRIIERVFPLISEP